MSTQTQRTPKPSNPTLTLHWTVGEEHPEYPFLAICGSRLNGLLFGKKPGLIQCAVCADLYRARIG